MSIKRIAHELFSITTNILSNNKINEKIEVLTSDKKQMAVSFKMIDTANSTYQVDSRSRMKVHCSIWVHWWYRRCYPWQLVVYDSGTKPMKNGCRWMALYSWYSGVLKFFLFIKVLSMKKQLSVVQVLHSLFLHKTNKNRIVNA